VPNFLRIFGLFSVAAVLMTMECGMIFGQDTPSDQSTSTEGASQADQTSAPSPTSTPSRSAVPKSVQKAPALDSSYQVAAPSVTLPTPPLPDATPSPAPSATPGEQARATPQPTPPPQFNPPSAQELNLPSAQPAGIPQFAPASVGMPSLKLDDQLGSSPGVLSGLFDWARKLRFLAALRGGYDSNINSANGTNAIGSTFVNLNGGVNYRFGAPRLNVNADLTGGVTQYANSSINQNSRTQETVGLGMAVQYRYAPKVVLTFNTSTSYQMQPNIALAGTANNSNDSYYYSSSSFAAAYQWSDLFTTVSRFNYTASYYPQNKTQNFTEPGFSQSFRYLYKPTTTAVVDYSTYLYRYPTLASQNSWGQTLSAGFDHIFNPKWYWNFRVGAQNQSSQNSSHGNGLYIGPYLDNTLSWQFGKVSSINWNSNLSTQPSSGQGISYTTALRSGLVYSQGLFAKMKLNSGLYYLLTNYKDVPSGPRGQTITYNITNYQGNLDLTYDLNRIIQLALGYQYISSVSPSVEAYAYNRGISYFQVRGSF
jgi:hypothetical protein